MEVAKQYSRRRRRNPSIDRLSDLPDSILCHILSFLLTRNSVATSILSRRWRYLWSFVPNLDFYFEVKSNTIDRVLLLHKLQKIDTFRITEGGYDYSVCQIETWIRFAVERNVKNLDLHFDYEGWVPPSPKCLLTCKTLVDLRLTNCTLFPVIAGAVCLPSLKILHLQFYHEYETLPHLLSGCPVLEDLLLQLYFNYCSCKISSPTIKSLRINFHYDDCNEDEDEGEDIYDRLEIDTPALVYLELVDSPNHHIKCGPLTSLLRADISFRDYVGRGSLHSRSLVEFIDRLHNIQFLKLDLSHYSEEIAQAAFPAQTTTFHHLIELELTADCRFLWKFLENADNLEILTFSECCEEIQGRAKPPLPAPSCILSRLRMIKLVKIKGKRHEFRYIKYLLRNAKVLKRMKITYSEYLDSQKMINMLKKISLFRRGSRACKVAFVGVR
ncbi:hypothetical protein ABFX02_13G075300 [Erythranthe guttata]